MSKILLVVYNDQNKTRTETQAILNSQGKEAKFVVEGESLGITPGLAAMWFAAGLPTPKTGDELQKCYQVLLKTWNGVQTVLIPSAKLYADKLSKLQLVGWKKVDVKNGIIEKAHIDLNLTLCNEELFPMVDGKARHVHLESSLSVTGETITQDGVNILKKYEETAIANGCILSSYAAKDCRYKWEFGGIKYSDEAGETRSLGIPKLHPSGVIYAVLENKKTGWGTVGIPVLDINGNPVISKDGKPRQQKGWGVINRPLQVSWGGESSQKASIPQMQIKKIG